MIQKIIKLLTIITVILFFAMFMIIGMATALTSFDIDVRKVAIELFFKIGGYNILLSLIIVCLFILVNIKLIFHILWNGSEDEK